MQAWEGGVSLGVEFQSEKEHQPLAKVMRGCLYALLRPISRIHFGMNSVRLCEDGRDHVVDVSWEALEARLVSHEAMEEDEEEIPLPITAGTCSS